MSLMAEVPEPLLQAMRSFIERHPNWDQYRLFQAALAGFLVQHAAGDRSITRCYLANLFPGRGRFEGPVLAGRDVSPTQSASARSPEPGSAGRSRLRAMQRPAAGGTTSGRRPADRSGQAA